MAERTQKQKPAPARSEEEGADAPASPATISTASDCTAA